MSSKPEVTKKQLLESLKKLGLKGSIKEAKVTLENRLAKGLKDQLSKGGNLAEENVPTEVKATLSLKDFLSPLTSKIKDLKIKAAKAESIKGKAYLGKCVNTGEKLYQK